MKELKEFPNEFIKFDVNINLDNDQIEKIKNYNRPSGMDDRWYIKCDENLIKFYRTWTGNCIYKAKINKNNAIIELYINKDFEQYKFSTANDELILFNEILHHLLPKAL